MIGRLFPLAKPLLHALDAEFAHNLAVAALGLSPLAPPPDDPRLRVRAFGLDIPNPVGLAAGLDKHAEAIDGALALGFGFVEIGGVTPQPQTGNPRPRVFRLPEDEAVINRYGLNSDGMEVVAGRLEKRRKAGRAGLVGANLGANKDSADRAGDYGLLVAKLAGLVDFLTINVSSPNTPGLRDLQAEAALDDLVARALAARDEAAASAGRRTPVLLKIAPDIGEAELDGIVGIARARGLDGLVVANTTVARPETLRSAHKAEAGGLSGRPLFEPSTRLLARAALRLEGTMPLVGVGGTDSAAAAIAKLEAGASLLQLYSALIYKGPGLIGEIKRGLLARMQRDGLASLAPLVGSRSREIAERGVS